KTHTILHFVPRSAELRNTAPSKKNDALSASELSKNFWLHGSDDLSNSSLTTHHSQLFCHFVPHAVQGFICEIDNHEQRAETRQLWNVPPASSLVLTLPLPTATANCPNPPRRRPSQGKKRR